MRTDPSKSVGGVPPSQSPSAKKASRELIYATEEATAAAEGGASKTGLTGVVRYFSSKEIRPFKHRAEPRHAAARDEQKVAKVAQNQFRENKKHYSGA